MGGVHQLHGVTVGLGLVAALVGKAGEQRRAGRDQRAHVAQCQPQAGLEHALFHQQPRGVAVFHMADLVRQHAHQRGVAGAGLARGTRHHGVGHHDGAAGQGEGVGRHAGAEQQFQFRLVVAIGRRLPARLGREAVELLAQLCLAGGRQLAGLDVVLVDLRQRLGAQRLFPAHGHQARELRRRPGCAPAVEGRHGHGGDHQHGQQHRQARLHALCQRRLAAGQCQRGLPGRGVVDLQAAGAAQVHHHRGRRAPGAPAFRPADVAVAEGQMFAPAVEGLQSQLGPARAGPQLQRHRPGAGAAAVEPAGLQRGRAHRGRGGPASQSGPAPARRRRRRRRRLAVPPAGQPAGRCRP